MSGVDARDFIRGTRPWAQFLTYTTYLAENVDGSAVWAAQLSDDRFLPMIEARLKELAKVKDAPPTRPSLNGYSREVDGLHRVANELRALRGELGKWAEPVPILGPLFPGDKLAARDLAVEVDDLAAAVAVGHQQWEEAQRG